MKRVLILSAAVLFCGVPLRAQVTKQVEVTKTYVPEVSKAVKLPIVPDMTDTVRLRPEIDYTVTPSALATNLSTEPFRPATVTYWEFNRPRPLYLKVGAGAPLNSVLDLYASTQNPGTGYAVGYLNHTGDWAEIRNDFGVRPVSWRMHNRMGAAAGKYLGRRLLEGAVYKESQTEHENRFLPAASIAYDPADGKFMLYAELTGKVRRNDMRTLSRLNPYVNPASIVPNTEEHRVAGGIKGAAGHGRFSYNLYVGYTHEKNALQWVARFIPNNVRDERADVGYMSFYIPYTMTLKDLSLNAEFAWRPSSRLTFDGELHMHSFKGAEDVYYNNNQPYTLAYGRPQLTARLRGEYRARKVSLEVEAQMQSVRHWTTYTSVNEKPSEPDSDSGLNLGRRVIGLYDFKVPVTVDLAARFNWFLSRKVTLFAEGRNLCDAKLYDWAYYRDYGVGFTAGVKLQF